MCAKRIGEQLGINPETLRGWVKQAEIDAGTVAGTTTDQAARVADLEREVREPPDSRLRTLREPRPTIWQIATMEEVARAQP
jgi:transposase-like protein